MTSTLRASLLLLSALETAQTLSPPVPLPVCAPAAFETGDLAFVRPHFDAASPFGQAILATGRATLDWMRAHGLPVQRAAYMGFEYPAIRPVIGVPVEFHAPEAATEGN